MRAGLEVVHLLELVLVIVEDVRHCGSYAKEGRLPVSTACLERGAVCRKRIHIKLRVKLADLCPLPKAPPVILCEKHSFRQRQPMSYFTPNI